MYKETLSAAKKQEKTLVICGNHITYDGLVGLVVSMSDY